MSIDMKVLPSIIMIINIYSYLNWKVSSYRSGSAEALKISGGNVLKTQNLGGNALQLTVFSYKFKENLAIFPKNWGGQSPPTPLSNEIMYVPVLRVCINMVSQSGNFCFHKVNSYIFNFDLSIFVSYMQTWTSVLTRKQLTKS